MYQDMNWQDAFFARFRQGLRKRDAKLVLKVVDITHWRQPGVHDEEQNAGNYTREDDEYYENKRRVVGNLHHHSYMKRGHHRDAKITRETLSANLNICVYHMTGMKMIKRITDERNMYLSCFNS